MKVRVTLLTENNVERTPEMTEAKVAQAWQLLLAYVCDERLERGLKPHGKERVIVHA